MGDILLLVEIDMSYLCRESSVQSVAQLGLLGPVERSRTKPCVRS